MRLENKTPQSKADFLFTVEGIPGYWATMTGITKTYSRGKYTDSLAAVKRPLSSSTEEYGDITITRPYDNANAEDIAAFDWGMAQKCGTPFAATITPIRRCKDIESIGNAFYFSGCIVTECKLFDGMDVASGEDANMLSITFSYDGVQRA